MGKGNKKCSSGGGGSKQKFTPNTNHPNARESDGRKAEQLRGMEMRRLKNKVDRQKEKMISYEDPSMKKRPKIHPLFDLKGPARAAREFYKDPNYIDDIENVNLLCDYEGRLYEHEEGKLLLQYMYEYGVSLYNNFNKIKEAEIILKEMMELDKEDHLRARDALLRCYLDSAAGEKVRELLDSLPNERCCLFAYSRALIEHISLLIEEEGSSAETRENALILAYTINPYALWCLVHSESFAVAVELVEEIPLHPPPGSIEDALLFFTTDIDIWVDTDGVLEWLDTFIEKKKLSPPSALSDSSMSDSTSMYLGMFRIAIEMAEVTETMGEEDNGHE